MAHLPVPAPAPAAGSYPDARVCQTVRAFHICSSVGRQATEGSSPMKARTLVQTLRRFLSDESGPTATEYAVMLALILLVVMAGVRTLGVGVSESLEASRTTMFP